MKTACVAAGHPLTVEAAEQILRDGGNAFDAAVAAFFMVCVAEPVLASLGGGGYMLARDRQNQTRVFDFFVQTPAKKKLPSELDFECVTVDFSHTQQDFHIGHGACATPGVVRGMFAIQRELGSMPMRELVVPAVTAARTGVKVTALQDHLFSLVEPIYVSRESARAQFGSRSTAGRVVRENDTLLFPEMADVLESLALEGEDLFYRGEIAHLIDQQCQAGGSLSYDDLRRYEVYQCAPVATLYRNNRVLSAAPSSAGGMLIAFTLNLLAGNELGEFGSRQHLFSVLDSLMLTREARLASTYPEQNWPDREQLLGSELLDRYQREMQNRSRAYRGTTHITIIDGKRNVASLTTSNGEGCGTVIPGTGIMLNNMLGEADLNPHGFHAWKTDQRMSSMMSPCLVEFVDGRLAALGSGGSNRIRSAILQTIINLVYFNMDVETAVLSPRVHYDDGSIFVEGGFSETVTNSLSARFPNCSHWDGINFFFGGVHTVLAQGQSLHGIGDPRRGGETRTIRVPG